MKKYFLILLITLTAASCESPFPAEQTPSVGGGVNTNTSTLPANNFVPNEVLVVFKVGTTPERMAQIATAVGGTVEPYTEGKTAYKITLAPTASGQADVAAAVAKIKAYQEISSAEPNAIITIPDCNTGPC